VGPLEKKAEGLRAEVNAERDDALRRLGLEYAAEEGMFETTSQYEARPEHKVRSDGATMHIFYVPLILIGPLALSLSAQDNLRRIVPAVVGRRLALVVGNQDYARLPLRNARADAQAMDALLRLDLGFTDVRRVEDATLLSFQRAVREFVRQIRPGDLALFYYAGHGMQVGGTNWMIPVDFHADFDDEVQDQAVPAQRVLKELEDAGAAVRIVILDACRDNPLPAAGRRSGKMGLSAMGGAEGTYVLFATGENQTADDNPRGANGLFTSYLVEAMRKPGITLDAAFKETRRAVAEASRGRQRPWLLTDIDRDVVLMPAPTGTTARQPTPRRDAAADAWEMVRGSTDVSLIEAFLREYGSSEYAGAARLKLSALRSGPALTSNAINPSPLGTASGIATPANDSPSMSASDLYANAQRDRQGGRLELALQEFADYIRWYGNAELAPNAQYYIASIHAYQGYYDDAVREYGIVIEKYPDTHEASPRPNLAGNNKIPDAMYGRSVALAILGRYTEGARGFQELIRRFPSNALAGQACTHLTNMGLKCSLHR
jgi:tetratricopeptide (TPR) repeat protein